MAELYLVRHAQASFGTDDYDRLSELGHRQSRWLGEYLAERGLAFDRTITGTLRRHRETLAGILAGGVQAAPAVEHAGLNEYEAETLLRLHLKGAELPPAPVDGDRRQHFRMLREALAAWTDGSLECGQAHLPFERFSFGVREAMAAARAEGARRVLVVSSGGPISTAIGAALGAPPATMVDLNLQMRNTGVSEFAFGARSLRVISFNNVPHLDRAERRGFVTYS